MAGNGAVHYRDGIDALLESVAGPAAKTGPRYLRLNGFEDKEVCPERHRKKTADGGAAGNLDQARIREIILETVERVTGKRTDSPTVAEWFERWIRTEKGAVAAHTMMRYEQIVRDFLSRGDWRSRATHAGLRAEVASLVSKGTDHHTECHHSRIIQTNASIRENPGATDFALAISKEHNGLVDR